MTPTSVGGKQQIRGILEKLQKSEDEGVFIFAFVLRWGILE